MTEAPRIEYEATGFEVFFESGLGLVMIKVATDDPDKKITLQMRQHVFDELCEQIAKAQSAEDRHIPRP